MHWALGGYPVLFALADGELDVAEQLAHANLVVQQRDTSNPNAMVAFGSQLANIRLLQGRGAEAAALLARSVESNPDQIASRSMWVAGLSQAGDGGSPGLIVDLIERLAIARDDALLLPALALAAEAAWCETQRERPVESTAATQLVERIAPFAALHSHLNVFGTGGFYLGSMSHALGQARAAAGDIEGAADAIGASISGHDRLGGSCFADRSRTALADLG